MALILNIETSADVCSVALGSDSTPADMLTGTEERDHSRILTLLIEKILKKNLLTMSDLEAVAVSEGPGSYTGLRIGVSTAKGIAYALQIPLLAISTLEAMAASVAAEMAHGLREQMGEKGLLCPMIDARRMEVYSAFYTTKGEQVTEIKAHVIGENSFAEERRRRKILYFGTGSEKCKGVLAGENDLFLEGIAPRADRLVPLAEEKFRRKEFADVAYFEPFYLKEFIATIPKDLLRTERKLQGKK
jgi:tRNA threonylcarbamoyladenosine biosynthesis protein TsaB